MTARLWPSGYTTGFCLSAHPADHARCRQPHTLDLDTSGCHCPTCAKPAAAVVLPTPAVAAAPDPIWGAGLADQLNEMELSA
jgi:hypothetical protein